MLLKVEFAKMSSNKSIFLQVIKIYNEPFMCCVYM